MKQVLLAIFAVILIAPDQGCQPGVSREAINRSDTLSAVVIKHPTFAEKKAILSSPETKAMVEDLDNYFDHKLGRRFNGAVLVARKGVVIFEKYQGYANLSEKTAIDQHTTFQLASTSKPFTAMGVLWLQQQGKLSIDDSVQKYLPAFPYPGVTIKTLLNHRSGLPNYLYFCEDYWKDRSRLMTNQDVLNIMSKYKPAAYSRPDRHYSYSNTNYCVLAAIVEKVTGEKFGKFLKETFFDPLEMKDTYVYNPNTDRPHPGQSLTYDYRSIPIADECYDGVVGDKNVYSTVEDLLKWDQALYEAKLFTPATLEAAYTPYSNEHPGIKNYGLGWHLLVYPDDSLKIVYHNGWWHGNNTVFYRFIKDSTTLIIFSNRYNRMVYRVKPLLNILHEAEGGDDDTGES